tara:strand:+ start:28051 stop:29148 length:1098 start_codon:yes stop_codon:yes gene_type:complete
VVKIESDKNYKIEKNLSFILEKGVPLIDVRSPGEFKKGAFPSSCNLPILNNKERDLVGLTYKNEGRKAAETLGYKLVSGNIKKMRVHSWKQFIKINSGAQLYCLRGGMRSSITSKWLKEIGINIPVIAGGYKALRSTCLETLESVKNDQRRWFILGGQTGAGKTKIISSIPFSIDLEYLSNHRGSAFGGHQSSQPTSINFENSLAITYLQHNHKILVLEDESRGIGKITLPETWYQKMQTSELIILSVSMEQRIENIFHEYIKKPLEKGIHPESLKTNLKESLFKIKKRLGRENYISIYRGIEDAFYTTQSEYHKSWIYDLLNKYYDPMYLYQLKQKSKRCILEGDRTEIKEFLIERSNMLNREY